MKSIKMIFLVMLTAALFFGGATFAEQAAVITAHDYLGEWVDQDGTTNIEIKAHHEEGNYIVNVQIDAVDSEEYDYIVWAYGCVWDEESGTLKSVSRVAGTGKYDADDEEISDFNEDYADAVFSLNEKGLLVWEDREINAGEGRTFELVSPEKTEAADEAEPTGSIITPNNPEIDIFALADGMYPAAFEPADLAEGALTFTVYWEDTFDIVEINQLAVGDTLYVDDTVVEVETVESEDGDILVNGGFENGGVTLRAYDEDNCWKAVKENDEHTYFNWGETTLPLAEDVTFIDSWDIENETVTATGAEAVAGAINGTRMDSFIPVNTTVRVEDGRIVEIIRVYMP